MKHSMLTSLAVPRLLAVRSAMPETYGLAAVDEQTATGTVLYSVDGPDRVCFTIAVGASFPLHASAPAEAFIAALPEPRRSALVGRLTFTRFTSATFTSRAAFEERLALIRRQGYAIDMNEETEGCHCGGVAVLNPDKTPAAALWFTGMSTRLPPDRLLACIKTLQGVGRLLEQDLRRAACPPDASGGLHALAIAEAERRLAADLAGTPDYSVLARACGVGYSTLRAAFRVATGDTLGQRRLRLRLEEACRLLAGTVLPVGEVAVRTGFDDSKHFSTQFKRRLGISPNRYRRENSTAPHQTNAHGVYAA